VTAPARERQTIEQMLAAARGRLLRVTPEQACQEAARGAMLVDIRPQAQRAIEGEIPGALIIERNVLEWRFDPSSAARLPEAGYDLRVIVFCSEGYTSSLAAAALQDLGLSRATDMDGGFCAWRRSGLPTTSSAAHDGAADGAGHSSAS
jgi:rhodanese-related sulfurtransferase